MKIFPTREPAFLPTRFLSHHSSSHSSHFPPPLPPSLQGGPQDIHRGGQPKDGPGLRGFYRHVGGRAVPQVRLLVQPPRLLRIPPPFLHATGIFSMLEDRMTSQFFRLCLSTLTSSFSNRFARPYCLTFTTRIHNPLFTSLFLSLFLSRPQAQGGGGVCAVQQGRRRSGGHPRAGCRARDELQVRPPCFRLCFR